MSIKEFNNKKQEIYNYVITCFGYTNDKLGKLFDELQPPTPPTCSTCTHLKRGKLWGECQNNLCDAMYERGWDDEALETISCIHHSDYGVKE